MGGSFSHLASGFCGKKNTKVIMLGMDNAGKTTMLYQIKKDSVTVTIPTIGMTVEELRFKNLQILSWDVGGRCKMRPLYRHFMKDVDVIVMVVDSSDTAFSWEVFNELKQLESYDVRPDVPVVVAANKQDLPHAMSPEEIRKKLAMDEGRLDRTKAVPEVFGTVATTGEGVFELLDHIALRTNNPKAGGKDVCEKEGITKTSFTTDKLHMAALKVKSLFKGLGNTI